MRFNCSDARGNVRKDGGELLYLRQLFDLVQSGGVTTEQAMQEIRKRWGANAKGAEDFLKDIAASPASAPAYPQQLALFDHSLDVCSADGIAQ